MDRRRSLVDRSRARQRRLDKLLVPRRRRWSSSDVASRARVNGGGLARPLIRDARLRELLCRRFCARRAGLFRRRVRYLLPVLGIDVALLPRDLGRVVLLAGNVRAPDDGLVEPAPVLAVLAPPLEVLRLALEAQLCQRGEVLVVVVFEVDLAAEDLLQLVRRDERCRVGLVEEADLQINRRR